MLVRCLGATHKVLGYSRYAFTVAAVRVGCCRSAARRCTAFRPAGCASCWAARARRGRAATTSCAAPRGCPPRSSRCSWRSPPTRRGRCAARYLCACFRCDSVPCGTCPTLDQARLSSKDLMSAPPASVASAMLICGACSRPRSRHVNCCTSMALAAESCIIIGGCACLQALLPPGMAELLRLAAEGGTEGAGPWPRVHAFNTLRLAFIERILAVSATPFVADGACPVLAPRWRVWTHACSTWSGTSGHAWRIAGTKCVSQLYTTRNCWGAGRPLRVSRHVPEVLCCPDRRCGRRARGGCAGVGGPQRGQPVQRGAGVAHCGLQQRPQGPHDIETPPVRTAGRLHVLALFSCQA